MSLLGLSNEEFKEKLFKGEIKISIHGQGYVGLPLAVLFAKLGIKVVAVTKDKAAAERILKGESPISETDPNSLLEEGAKINKQKCPLDGVNLFEYEGNLFCPMCLRIYTIEEEHAMMKQETLVLKKKMKTLSDYLKEALDSGNYELIEDNIEAAKKTDIHIITVPTYADNYDIVLLVCKEIAKGLQKDGDVIINKSTVPVGATRKAKKVVAEIKGKGIGKLTKTEASDVISTLLAVRKKSARRKTAKTERKQQIHSSN